jgi:hypothetical protein
MWGGLRLGVSARRSKAEVVEVEEGRVAELLGGAVDSDMGVWVMAMGWERL